MKKPYFIVTLFVIISLALCGQTVQLNLDKKHITEIKLCTNTSSTEIPEGYFELTDSVYFVLRSKEGDLSKGDFKDLSALQFSQDGEKKKINRLSPNLDDKKNITSVLLVVARSVIDITKPFEFLYEEEYKSDLMAIPERYWPYYTQFMDYYEKGKDFMDKQQYIASFDQLKYIISESEHAVEFTKFSNYYRVYNDFVPDIITGYQKKQMAKLENLQSKYGSNDRIVLDELEQVRLAKDSVILVNQIFEPFYRITEQTPEELRLSHKKLIEDFEEFYNATYVKWKVSVLTVIESGFYRDENKYEVFIELLARLLVYTNQVNVITAYDSIDVSLISDSVNQVKFLSYHIRLLENMKFENWKNEFITVVRLLNEEIKINNRILGSQHLFNLSMILQEEDQPNYYIINGFNELVKGEFIAFSENIQKAIAKCTDKEMMYYLELWMFSERLRNEDPNPPMIDALNSGLVFEAKRKLNDALKQYEMAIRLGKNALPYFLIGRIKLDHFEDIYVADQYFNDAIQISPDFALARIYHIEILIMNKEFAPALSEIETALKIPHLAIWYIYFLKAKVLYSMGKFKEALAIVETNFNTFNANNFEQYILSGDIYLALKDCEKARENYSNAGKIDPNNATFSSSMENYHNQCKK